MRNKNIYYLIEEKRQHYYLNNSLSYKNIIQTI